MNKLKFDAETNNDDEFFGDLERARNNLGQLFGVSEQLENEQNHTLKYTPPPKQPSVAAATTLTPQQQHHAWTTQLAKVANAYKAGDAIGKVGVALLSNAAGACKMIIYKTKANVVATLSLNTAGDSGQLHRQSGYLQFYDDELQAWSLRFDKAPEEEEFLKKLLDLGIRIQEKLENDKDKETPKESVKEVSQTIVLKPPALQADEKLRARCKELSKSKLITRMAKVGQQLPSFVGAGIPEQQTSEYSDSSDTEMLVTPSSKPKIAPRGATLQPKAQMLAAQLNAYSSNAASMSLGGGGSSTPMETQFLQMLLTENRTQNTEVRLNINKLEGKLEKVLDRIEGFNSTAASHHRANKEDELLELEEKLLALKKENRRLRQALEAKAPPSSPPQSPPQQRLEQKLFESIVKTHRNDLAALGVEVSKENSDLNAILQSLIEKAQTAQHKLELAEAANASAAKKLKSHEHLLREEQRKHAEISESVHDLEEAVNSLQAALKTKDRDYTELQEQLAEKLKAFAAQSDLDKMRCESTVKTIMNNLYRNLVGKIENVSALHKPEILALIGRTIRAETLKAMEQVKQ